jgi:hypothetical protein
MKLAFRGAILLLIMAAPRSALACVLLDQDASAAQSVQPAAPPEQPAPQPPPAEPPPAPEASLDFNLLGDAKPGLLVDENASRRRRTLLQLHQAAGLGLFAIALGNTVVGQLNYSDRFANGPSTGRYELAHQITAYTTVGAFAATGLLALFAPTPLPKESGSWDRISWHKLAVGAATAGIAAEAVLGIWTARREGFQNQSDLAAVHLAIGYFTFAAISLGVGVIVF